MKHVNSAKRLGPLTIAATVMTAIVLGGCAGQTGPRGVMEKSVHAMMDGNYSLLCTYAPPDERDACGLAISLGAPSLSGSIKLGRVVQDDGQAIGSLVGHVCETTNGSTACGSNSNSDTGLPHGTESFAAAYQADNTDGNDDTTQTPSQQSFWTVTALEQDGRWYVDLSS